MTAKHLCVRLSLMLALAGGFASEARAWFENGHHLIAVMAYQRLTAEQQVRLRQSLKHHPRYAEDFNPPADLKDDAEIQLWLVGRASYWPDVARGSSFDRPTWHYQLGATLTIGEPPSVPQRPGQLPTTANLDTQEIYLSQAIELCRQVWRDRSASENDRALALCWLGHLVADSHQPCHAGSLYSTTLFPRGDRGGNLVTTKQGNNLHLFWDARMGSLFDAKDLNERLQEILTDKGLIIEAKAAANGEKGLDPLTWISESSELGANYVYAAEILTLLTIAEKAKATKPEMIELSEEYVSLANRIARRRTAWAAERLAKIWSEGL